MNVEEAVVILLVAQSVGAVLGIILSRWVLRREIYNFVDELADTLFGKAKMSNLGTISGEKRHAKAMMDKMATDILDGPQLKGLKGIASMIGIDIDEYIQEHGAAETISTATSLANMLGIDITKVLTEGINTNESKVSGDNNPYLQR